jgi:hypothetical protein
MWTKCYVWPHIRRLALVFIWIIRPQTIPFPELTKLGSRRAQVDLPDHNPQTNQLPKMTELGTGREPAEIKPKIIEA